MSEYFLEPLQKIQGSGQIKFNATTLDVIFSIEHLTTGGLEGEAVLNISAFKAAYSIFSDLIIFNIIGKTTDDQNIEVNSCYALSFNESNNIKLKFIAQEVIYNPARARLGMVYRSEHRYNS